MTSPTDKRCRVTGNPCGTDTVFDGQECPGGGKCEPLQSATRDTDTPRTDAKSNSYWQRHAKGEAVNEIISDLLDDARQLERELADAQNEIADLWNDKRVMREQAKQSHDAPSQVLVVDDGHVGKAAARKMLSEEAARSSIATRTAKDQFDEYTAGEDMTPLERLRFFCSLAFKEPQDWLDVEPFFDALEKQLSAPSATAASDWISVKDRMPPENTSILFFDGEVQFGWYGPGYGNLPWRVCNAGWDGDSGPAAEVTHWMPLPSAPTERGAKNV